MHVVTTLEYSLFIFRIKFSSEESSRNLGMLTLLTPTSSHLFKFPLINWREFEKGERNCWYTG